MERFSGKIIDCHIHPFLTEDENFHWFKDTVTPEEFVAEMKRAGIAKCCGSVLGSNHDLTPDGIARLNRDALKFRDRFPDFYIPGIVFHPDFPEESCREIERLHRAENIRWIGEIVPGLLPFREFNSKGAFEVYALLQELNLPVNIHPITFDQIEDIARNFPRLAVVIAHTGNAKAGILERSELTAKYPNLYLDLSGCGVFRWGMLRNAIDTAGKEKFLFGTDFPICNPGMLLQGVLFEHLSDAEFEAVLSGNFRRLTGL